MIRRMLGQLQTMLGSLLELQNKVLSPIDSEEITSPLTPKIQSYIDSMIDADLKKLSNKKSRVLDSSEGYIDYYSPLAEEQINHKEQILKKYLEQITLLQATIICISQKKKEIDSLKLQEPLNEQQQIKLKE